MGNKKGTRNLVRRDLKQAVTNIDRVMEYLVRSGLIYQEPHPEIYAVFCEMVASLNILKKQANDLHDSI